MAVVYSRRTRPWYFTGGEPREHRRVRRASAVAAQLGFSAAPLVVRPERLADKVAALAGYDDIDFPALPELSRRFYVNGPDPGFALLL